MRARFEENKHEVDMRKAKKLLIEGERELFQKRHPQPLKCMSLVLPLGIFHFYVR